MIIHKPIQPCGVLKSSEILKLFSSPDRVHRADTEVFEPDVFVCDGANHKHDKFDQNIQILPLAWSPNTVDLVVFVLFEQTKFENQRNEKITYQRAVGER